MTDNQPSQFQRILTALAASILVFYLWIFVYQKFLAPAPPPAQSQPAATVKGPASGPSSQPATTLPAERTETVGIASTGPSISAPAGQELVAVGASDTTDVTLGNAEKSSPYPMALDISPVGAAVRQAWVRGYYQTVKKEQPYMIFHPLVEDGIHEYSLQTPRIRFVELDQEVQLNKVVWKKESLTDQQAVFSVQINQADGKPLARVVKTYKLAPQPAKVGVAGETYDMHLSTAIENLSGQKLQAVLVQQGPVGLTQESRVEDRAVVIGMYEQGREREGVVAKAHHRKEFASKGALELGRDDENRRIAWVGESNQYFTCIMAPVGRAGLDSPSLFERAEAIHLTQHTEEYSQDLSFRYVTDPLTIEPGKSQPVEFECYIGPKSKTIFQANSTYESRNYYAVITTSFYACAPTALVGVMMALLNTFYRIPPHNYGIAIFLLVVLVRGILHPITKRSQVNMMKMQKQMAWLQPKLQAAKEKYANDRAGLNQATMEIYRDAGVNPAGSMLSCLPMMLQLPIWAALWTALNSTVAMRHAPLDGWWIKDLTQPDALIPLSGAYTIPLASYLMGGPLTAINLLPILLGISQLLQAKYMPRSNAPANPDNPDQMEQQRKMMMFMSVFFFFMFYNMPSGLNLYIMTSNIAGIVEQWRIRKHVEEEEKKGKFDPSTKTPKPKGWLTRKWEELQKEAEEAKRIQSDRKKKR